MCKYMNNPILRQLTILALSSCISFATSFVKFKRDDLTDGQICANISFVKPNTTVSKCAISCGAISECKRFVFKPEDNVCTGCSQLECTGYAATNTISFVRWEQVTYRYVGCFSDYSDRVLNGTSVEHAFMTNDFCFGFCIQGRGYRYFGTQLGTHCFCGNTYEEHGRKPDIDCTSVCSGDNTTTCGGPWKNSLYVAYF